MSSMSAPTSRHRYILMIVILLVAGLLWWSFGRSPDGGRDDDDPVAEREGKGAFEGKDGFGRRGGEGHKSSDLDWKRTDSAISGKVSNKDGAPIPQADVCAWVDTGDVPSSRRRVPVCGRAGGDGRYTITGLAPARYRVSASAEGYIPRNYKVGRVRDVLLAPGQRKPDIDIVLKAGGAEVRGIVKDISGGEIDGAFVVASAGGWWGGGGGKVGVRTNADGEFRLWTRDGSVSISAVAEGYAESSRNGTAPGYTFELFLTPESVLRGRVVDAKTGAPVPDAKVVAESNGAFFFRNGASMAFTDAEGRYRIDGLSPGHYKPTATTTAGWGQAAETAHVGLAETSDEVEIRLHAAVTVSARIVVAGAEDTGCTNASFTLKKKYTEKRFWGRGNDEGHAEIKGVFPGTYEVNVYCADYVPREEYDDLEVGEEPVDGLVYEVDQGLAIRGVVVDSGGQPVEGARIMGQAKGGSARGQRTNAWGVHSEEDGSFELAGLIPGTYELDAIVDDYPGPEPKLELEVPVGSDVEGVKLELQASGQIVGRVEDESGAGVPNANVRVLSGSWRGKSQRTTDDGSFELKGVEVGEQRLVAQRGWSEEMRAPGTTDDEIQGEQVNVTAGDTTEVTLLVEDQSGKISGRVVDETGGPVHDAFIESTRESDSQASAEGSSRQSVRWGQWDAVPVLTDQDGRFELKGLSGGKYTIRAFRKGGGDGLVEHVKVGSKGVEVSIRATGSMSGKVTVGGGGSPERFRVQVHDEEQAVWRRESFFRTSGTWTMEELPPGSYKVSVSAEEGDATQEDVPLKETEAKTGIDLELTAKVTIRGSVVDVDSGDPVPGMSVNVSAGAGGMYTSGGSGKAKKNVSDEQGKFEVENAPSGEVTIGVFPRDWSTGDYQFAWMKRTLPAKPKVVDLDPIRVAKKTMDNDERPGDLGFKMKEDKPGEEWSETALVVGFVRPGGPAQQAGIAAGDTITKIGSHDVTGDNKYLYYSFSKVKQGAQVQLTFDGGKEATITAGKPI